jgi:AraC-like DNA-binding protein
VLIRVKNIDTDAFFASILSPKVRVEFSTFGHNTLNRSWLVMPRAIPEHMFYLMEERAIEGRVAGRRMRLSAGDLLWMSPGVIHEWRIPPGAPGFRLYHTKLTLRRAPAAPSLRLKRDYLLLRNAAGLGPLFAQLLHEITSDAAFAEERRRAQLVMFLSEILRRSAATGDGGRVLTQHQCRALSEYFHQHALKRPSVSDLAEVLRLSPEYFAIVFKQTYGISPRAWLVRERMHLAARRLQESQLTISEVAYEFGYPDVFLFSRQFSQTFGQSPRAYRRQL